MLACNLLFAQEGLEDQDVPKERERKGCVDTYYYMGHITFFFLARMWYEHAGYKTNTHFEVGIHTG